MTKFPSATALLGTEGFALGGGIDRTDTGDCGCEFCEGYRAANALYPGRFRRLELSLFNANLQRAIFAWSALDIAIRTAIMALSETVSAQWPRSPTWLSAELCRIKLRCNEPLREALSLYNVGHREGSSKRPIEFQRRWRKDSQGRMMNIRHRRRPCLTEDLAE